MTSQTDAPRTSATDSPLDRARELHDWVAAGRIDDCMKTFYADDVVMRENQDEPVVGLEANIVREQEFVAGVAEWKAYDVHALAADGDTVLAEISMTFVTTGGDTVHVDQTSVSRWKDGQILSERFYHG